MAHRIVDPYDVDPETAELVAEYPLATLVTPFEGTIHVSHLPLVLSVSAGERAVLVGHLARANPHATALAAGASTVAVFNGPQGYLSASWYAERDMAPTWCYVAARLYGQPTLSNDDAHTLRCVQTLVEHLERARPNGWRMAELGGPGIARRVPKIVGFEIPVTFADVRSQLGEGERPADLAVAIERLRHDNPALAALIAANNDLPFLVDADAP